MTFCTGRVENIVGKGENAGYQLFSVTSIFSFSNSVFKRLLFHGRLLSELCKKGLEVDHTFCLKRYRANKVLCITVPLLSQNSWRYSIT